MPSETLIPPDWSSVESDSEYQKLSPEDQAQTLSNWATATRAYGDTQGWWEDPETQKQFTESSQAKLREIQGKLPPITGASSGLYGENPVAQAVGIALDRANLGVQEFAPRTMAAADQLLSLATRFPEAVTAPIDAVAGTTLTEGYQGFNKLGAGLNEMAQAETRRAQEISEAGSALGGGPDIPYLGKPGDLLQQGIPTAMQAFQDIALSGGAGTVKSLEAPAKTALGAIMRNAQSAPVKRVAAIAGGEQALATLNQEIQQRVQDGETPAEAQIKALPKSISAGLITTMATSLGGFTGAESILKEYGIKGLKNKVIETLKESGLEAAEEMTDQFGNQISGWLNDEFDPAKEKTGSWEDRLGKAVNLSELYKAGFLGGFVGGSITAIGQTAEAIRDRGIVEQASVQADRLRATDSPQAANAIEEIAAADIADSRIESQRKSASILDELMATPEEEMSRPQDILEKASSPENISASTTEVPISTELVEGEQFAPPPAEISAVSSEAGAEQPISDQESTQLLAEEALAVSQQPDPAPYLQAGESARARVEEAMATGVAPDPADIELAGATITPASEILEPPTVLPSETLAETPEAVLQPATPDEVIPAENLQPGGLGTVPEGGVGQQDVTNPRSFKLDKITPPETVEEWLQLRETRKDAETRLIQEEIGVTRDQAEVIHRLIVQQEGTGERWAKKNLTPEQQQKFEQFWEESEFNQGDGPVDFLEYDSYYNPELLETEKDVQALAKDIVVSFTNGAPKEGLNDKWIWTVSAIRKLQELGGTKEDIAKALAAQSGRMAGSQSTAEFWFREHGKQLNDIIERFAPNLGQPPTPTTEPLPPQSTGKAIPSEGTPADQSAATEQQPITRVQLRVSPQSFRVVEKIPQTEAEKNLGEQYYRVVNERTSEEQIIEQRDIAREIRPKSEQVKRAIKKLPEKSRAKAEIAVEIDTSPDAYQGAPLTDAEPLTVDENLDLLSELASLGVLDEGATGATILQNIVDHTHTPQWAKTLAKRLLEISKGKIDVNVVNRPSSGWYALYSGEPALIQINLARRNLGVTNAILHETSHHITLEQIRNPESLTGEAKKAYDDLVAIHAEISALPEFQGEYGVTSVEEMVAEAFSNAGFRRKLDGIKSGKQTLWQKLVNAIARLLFNKPAADTSLLHRAIEDAFTLAGAPVVEARGTGAAMAGGVTPEKDAAYMDAVQRGDIKTAQKMVDDAAYAAGFTKPVKHGTHQDFTEFNRRGAGNRGKVFELNEWGIWTTEDAPHLYGSKTMHLYGKMQNPKRFQTFNEWLDDYIKTAYPLFAAESGNTSKDLRKDLSEYAGKITPGSKAYNEMLAEFPGAEGYHQKLRAGGYDGVLIEGDFIDGELQTVRVFLDANQLKSADPVTRINGKIVPLSQRFNPSSNLIAAMAESGSWETTLGNPNASTEAEAKALTEATQEIEAEPELDVTPLTDAQRALLEETETFKPLGIASFFATQFSNIPGTDFSDRQGEAIQGLVKAARSYNPESGTSFFQYANGVIRNHMRDFAKSRKVRSKYVKEDRPVLDDDDIETVVSTAPSPKDITIQENDRNRMRDVAKEALTAVMSRASERDRNILRDYASGMNMRDTGAANGVSAEGVRKILARYRENVSKALFLRGVNDLSEILAPVEEQTTAEVVRKTQPEDEQQFTESTVGQLEAQDIAKAEPIYTDEGLVDEGVFAAEGGDIDPLAQNDAISSSSSWIPANLEGTSETELRDLQTFQRTARTGTLTPEQSKLVSLVRGDRLTETFRKELEKIFGKRLVFLEGLTGESPSGIFLPWNEDALYLNINGNYPLMFLTGHEFGHSLKSKNGALYNELQQFVLDNATDWTAYKARLAEKGYSEQKIVDEFTEDFIGAHFNDGLFWRRLWQKDKPLFERLVQAAMDFLNALTGKMSSMSRDVRPYFKNWEETRERLVSIVEQAKAERPMVAPMAERPDPSTVESIKQAVNDISRTYIPPATKPGESYEIDPSAQTVWSAVLEKGQLPASLREVYDRLSNRINAVRGKVKVYTEDVKRAVEALHKTKDAREAEYGRIQKALTQQDGMTIESLDESLRNPVWKVRNTLDTLSKAAIDYGIVEGELADTFRDGIGNYMRRGYAVFDPESGWTYKFLKKKKPEVLEQARIYLKQKNPEATPDQIETTIKDLLDRDSAAGFILGGKKVLGKSIGSLMERKNIAKPIRDLLGEITDPLVNTVRSGDFLGQLIAREEMQQEFRKTAIQLGWASNTQDSTFTSPLVDDTYIQTQDNDGNPIFRVRSNRRYDVLRGLYTTPEFRKAFEMAEQMGDGGAAKRATDFLVGAFLTGSATAKTYATVLNPDSYAPNYIGAIMAEIGNGRWKPSTWRDAWSALRSGKNANAVISASKQAGIKDARQLHNELLRGGIFDQNITFRDFEATLKNSYLRRLASSKPLEAIGKIYSAGDNLGKANAFVDEITTLKKAYPDMPYRELVDKASQIVMDTTPTYSTVPKILRDISQAGFFLQNFFNFTYSINRVAGYTAWHGIKEIRSGNPVLIKRGFRRLAGLTIVMSAASYWGAAMLSRWMEGLDDEEDQAFRRSFAAPWDRDANLLYTNVKDGKLTYSNTSYLNPFALVAETVTAVYQGKTPVESAQGAMRVMMGNFFSEGILLTALLDVARNRKKGTTSQVYNEELDLISKSLEAGGYVISRALTPKVITKAIRTYKGITGEQGDYGKVYSAYDEALRLAGYRANTVDIVKQLPYRLYDLNGRYRDAERILRTAESRGWKGEDLEQARRQSDDAKMRVLRDYKQLYQDGRILGITPIEFRKAMSETKTQMEVRRELAK